MRLIWKGWDLCDGIFWEVIFYFCYGFDDSGLVCFDVVVGVVGI